LQLPYQAGSCENTSDFGTEVSLIAETAFKNETAAHFQTELTIQVPDHATALNSLNPRTVDAEGHQNSFTEGNQEELPGSSRTVLKQLISS
jgi:hypothetical protein